MPHVVGHRGWEEVPVVMWLGVCREHQKKERGLTRSIEERFLRLPRQVNCATRLFHRSEVGGKASLTSVGMTVFGRVGSVNCQDQIHSRFDFGFFRWMAEWLRRVEYRSSRAKRGNPPRRVGRLRSVAWQNPHTQIRRRGTREPCSKLRATGRTGDCSISDLD